MKKRLLLTMLVLSFAVICFAAIADISGKWTGTLNTSGSEAPVTYTFKADGDKLTGSVEYGGGNFNITDGKIKGDSLFFNVDYNGSPVPNSAKCYKDSIGLDVTIQDQVFHIDLKPAGK
jgi:hypothetical protein